MDKRYPYFKHSAHGNSCFFRIILVFLALCGIAMGCGLASILNPDIDSLLFSYLKHYFSLLDADKCRIPTFGAILWEVLHWPLLSGLLGTTLIGPLTSPLFLSLRSFFLSYTVSVFIRFFGLRGLLSAAIIFGIPALTSIVSLFLISLDVLTFHRSKIAGEEPTKMFLPHLVFLSGWLFFGIFLHYRLSPILLRFISI